MRVELELRRGGRAAIVSCDGDQVTLQSSAASPPGSTLEATRGNVSISVKVRGCKQAPDDTNPELVYRIEGRFVSLSRSDREALFGS